LRRKEEGKLSLKWRRMRGKLEKSGERAIKKHL
jgi:hypothetical protein